MKQIYCIEYLEHDCVGRSEAYVCARDSQSAQKKFSGDGVFFLNAKVIEHWDEQKAWDCINWALCGENGDDVLVFVLQKYPHVITADLVGEILNGHNPKAFLLSLTAVPLSDCREDWLDLAAEYEDLGSLRVLLQKGLRDNKGVCLAYACEHGNREMFDLLLPFSNAHKAMQIITSEDANNSHWVQEVLNQQQRERLIDQVGTGTPAVRKKL